jgi:hypothetical protein
MLGDRLRLPDCGNLGPDISRLPGDCQQFPHSTQFMLQLRLNRHLNNLPYTQQSKGFLQGQEPGRNNAERQSYSLSLASSLVCLPHPDTNRFTRFCRTAARL